MYAKMSDDELIQHSVLIVTDEWMGQSSVKMTNASGPMEFGAIRINEVLKGPPQQSLVLVPTTNLSGPRSGSDITYHRGDKGLWMLRQHETMDGIYLADHPQRFIPAANNAARIETIRKALKRQ